MKVFIKEGAYMLMAIEWFVWLICIWLMMIKWSQKYHQLLSLVINELIIIRCAVTLILGEQTRKRFDSQMDQLVFVHGMSSGIYMIWFLQTNSHLSWWIRIPLSIFNGILYVGTIVIYHAGSFEELPKALSQLNTGSFAIIGSGFNLLFFEMYNHQAMVNYAERLMFQFDQVQVHQKYHLIIHNLSSSIITIKDRSISYFNQGGQQILKEATNKIDDEEGRRASNKEVDQLASDIQSIQPSKTSTLQPSCPQQLILNQPLF